MRRIEEANKFELASSIKALVARALADEMIEGGMSAYGPSVWTGRALQAENDDLEKVGLALLYPAYGRSL
jgi:hypothetical protein